MRPGLLRLHGAGGNCDRASQLDSPNDNTPLLWVDGDLRTPYVQSWFAGIQQQFTSRWYFEASHMGSLGRKLITSDTVKRAGATNPEPSSLTHRSNSGGSAYTAVGALARYHATRVDLQASYTWSHSIDNQSDPMLGDPFNLARFNPENPGSAPIVSTFASRLTAESIGPVPISICGRTWFCIQFGICPDRATDGCGSFGRMAVGAARGFSHRVPLFGAAPCGG